MPYYKNYILINERIRSVIAEKDLLGLLWLSKIKIFSFLLFMLLLCSCTFFEKKKNKSKEETVDYYNGVLN